MSEEAKVVASREYRISLRRAYWAARTRRAKRAVAIIREFAARHMKTEVGKVKIDPSLNVAIWSRSRERPPRYVDVVIEKREDGTVLVKPKQ
ncbi:MAG: 50S ribosomal protein L31e [Thermoproteus sp.]|jgi:large subunit ribosomal protein L31e|uniref:Large ribosomal subunit protein eL31 n=1 Tax=Thermoproteus uzoniensis (strain 768-20) TaxID=999630 RepID=F2L1Y6_THEU7|nr:50S ribosomal protein L31e [Thermoproteus uzoniensis]AEA11727.1 Ribosomal protein L31e [Thermoproteus uzoniensis 768-20]